LPDSATLRAGLHFARAPGIVFAVSDFLDWPSALSEALVRLRHMRHDVRALCLQTQAECDASFAAGRAYRDPEQRGGVFGFAGDMKDSYRRSRDQHFGAVTAQSRQHDIPLTAARIEQPPGEVLRRWMRRPGRA
jgi:hypothetical protein